MLENGSEHEEYLLKTKTANDENFGFLFPENPYHNYYKTYLEWLKSPDSQTQKFDFLEILKKTQKLPQMKEENPQLKSLPIQNNANFNDTSMGFNKNNTSIMRNLNNPSVQQAQINNINNNFNNNGNNTTKKKNRWSESANPQNNYDIYPGGQAYQPQPIQIQPSPLMTSLQMNMNYPQYNQNISNTTNYQVFIKIFFSSLVS